MNEIRKETARLIKHIYSYSPAGSHCHIVLHDDQFEDDAIAECFESTNINLYDATPAQLEVERKFLTNMLELSMEERAFVVTHYKDFQ